MDGEPSVVVEQTPPPESVEAAGEAAVAIAEIQANRDVEIAQINADTTEHVIEAEAASDDEDIQWLRGELADLRGLCEMNAGALSALQQSNETLNQQVASLTETVATQAAALILLTPPQPSPEPGPEPEGAPAPPAPPPEEGGTIRKKRWM
jgi:hypothetical protein